MIKGIFQLENDITARAGQFLIMRDDNSMHVVSLEALEALFKPAPAAEVVESVEEPKAKRNVKRDKPFGYYQTAEALERAKARGRHMAAIRKQRLEAKRREAVAAE